MSKHKLNLGQFIRWDWGENYPFNACMGELMRILYSPSPTRLDYGFFAGVSGDDFVMCYGNNGCVNDCVSVVTDSEPFLTRVFGLIGQDYTLVKNADVTGNPDQTFARIRDSIMSGIPVLAKGPADNGNYSLIVSYDDDSGVCDFSCGDEVNYPCAKPLAESGYDLIFIETLPEMPPEKEVYRAAVLQLPGLMTAEPTERGVYFGASAYRKWAEDILTGRYDDYTGEGLESWRDWCVYVCNLATNAGHGRAFLERAHELNPDLGFIPGLIRLFDENTAVWNELESIGAGFNVTPDALKNPAVQRQAADALERLAVMNERIVELIQG